MPDLKSPKTRAVVYLEGKEVEAAKKKAEAGGHKNVHRWAASVIKRELKK